MEPPERPRDPEVPLVYEHCDIPEGMTVEEFRRRRAHKEPPQGRLRRWMHKRKEEDTR